MDPIRKLRREDAPRRSSVWQRTICLRSRHKSPQPRKDMDLASDCPLGHAALFSPMYLGHHDLQCEALGRRRRRRARDLRLENTGIAAERCRRRELDRTPAEVALAWTVARTDVSSVLVGASGPGNSSRTYRRWAWNCRPTSSRRSRKSAPRRPHFHGVGLQSLAVALFSATRMSGRSGHDRSAATAD